MRRRASRSRAVVPERALAHTKLEVVGAQRHGTGRIEARALVTRARALSALERHGDAEGAADAGLAVAGRVLSAPKNAV
jgi:hypothetical protein